MSKVKFTTMCRLGEINDHIRYLISYSNWYNMPIKRLGYCNSNVGGREYVSGKVMQINWVRKIYKLTRKSAISGIVLLKVLKIV